MKRAKNSQSLQVVIDCGTSLIKVLYKVGDSISYLIMEPQLLQLPLSSLDSLSNNSLGLGRPQDSAWIRYQKGEQLYVVGRLATEYQASVSIRKLKYESIVPKVLAVVGAIALLKQLKSRFYLRLGLLLPWSESGNIGQIQTELEEALKDFYYQKHRFETELVKLTVFPEASGLAMSYVRSFGLESFQNRYLAYLMFGYRNTSLLVFRKGTLSKSESSTTGLGFYSFIDKVCNKVSGLSRDEVQKSIRVVEQKRVNSAVPGNFEYIPTTQVVVEQLIKSGDTNRAMVEKNEIEKAIAAASGEYWQLLVNWLSEVLPSNIGLNQVVYCGGASEFFKSELANYLNKRLPGVKVSNSTNEEKELSLALGLNTYQQQEFKEQNLVLRLADVWGVFAHFIDYQSLNQDLVEN